MTKGHQVLAQLLEYFRVLATANALVTFQYAFGDARFEHVDIAGNAKPRHLGSEIINLPAPIRMLGLAHYSTPKSEPVKFS